MNGYSDHLMLLNERGGSPTFPFTSFKSEQSVWSTDLFTTLGASNFYDPNYETLDAAGSANTYMNLAPVESTPLLQHESEGLNYNYKPTFIKMDSDSNANVGDSGIDSPPSKCQSVTPPMEIVIEGLNLSDPVNESGNSNTNDSGTLETGPSSPIFVGGEASVPPFERQCVKCGCYVNFEFFWKNAQGHMFCQACFESQANVPIEGMPSKRKKKTASRRAAENISCSNCRTRVTTLWRRTDIGDKVCNACGLYKKLHHRDRPVDMNKDTIQRRNRTKTGPRQQNAVTKAKNARGKQRNIISDAAVNSSQLVLRSSSSQQICQSPPHQLVPLESIPQPIREQPAPQQMLPPPPPYHYYAADVNNSYQFLPPLENIPYYNNQEIHFQRFQGNNIQ